MEFYMNINALFELSYGLYVVSTMDGKRPTGCVINTATQITATPPAMTISVHRDNYTNECIKKEGRFAISIFSENADPKTIGIFGFQSGKNVNKFEQVSHEIKNNLPIIKDSRGYIICKVINKMEVNTHTVFIGEIEDADIFPCNAPPMTYSYYHSVVKGKTPKNAATANIEVNNETKVKGQVVYRCRVCGYEYDGPIPFENLTDDWKCPICNEPKSAFEKVIK